MLVFAQNNYFINYFVQTPTLTMFYFNENYPKDICFTFFNLILSRLIMSKSKTYSNKDIESALRYITEKHISISQAAKDYNIPRKTLADRKNKRWNSDKVGDPTKLTHKEESSLNITFFYMASHASPLNIKQMTGFACAILIRIGREKQFKEGGPPEKWWRGFKKQHPDLSLRTLDSVDRIKSNGK